MTSIPSPHVVRGDMGRSGESGEPRAPAIVEARRRLPRALVWRIVFGEPIVAFGWLFAAFGMLCACVFLPMIVGASRHDRDAVATVTQVERTNNSDNGESIYRVRYAFVDGSGGPQRGALYTSSPPVERATLRVKYRHDDPSDSQLEGMGSLPFPAFWLILLTLPLGGVGLVAWRLPTARRDLRLLRDGAETRGKLIDKRETQIELNEVPVMALTFAYEVDGARYTATVKTLKAGPLEDDTYEAMLYDPRAPAQATTLDHLPGSPKIAASGELKATPGIVVHLLVAPLAFIALVVATVLRLL